MAHLTGQLAPWCNHRLPSLHPTQYPITIVYAMVYVMDNVSHVASRVASHDVSYVQYHGANAPKVYSTAHHGVSHGSLRWANGPTYLIRWCVLWQVPWMHPMGYPMGEMIPCDISLDVPWCVLWAYSVACPTGQMIPWLYPMSYPIPGSIFHGVSHVVVKKRAFHRVLHMHDPLEKCPHGVSHRSPWLSPIENPWCTPWCML